MRSKALLVLFIFSFTYIYPPASSHAEFLKLKNPASIKLRKLKKGRVFDKKETKMEGPFLRQDALLDYTQEDDFVKLWAYAETFHGLAQARLRGIDYEDFVLEGDAPAGSKIKCDLLIIYDCFGLVNASCHGRDEAFYCVKLNSGLLIRHNQDAWDEPALGKTIFLNTDDPEVTADWKQDLIDRVNQDFAKGLVWQIQPRHEEQSTRSSAAGESIITIILDVLDLDLNVHKEDEKKDLEFSVAGSGTVSYEDVWLTVGEEGYRVFLSLDIQALAISYEKSHDVTDVYVDFYHHAPHYGDDGGQWMPQRGFRIKEVAIENRDLENIVLPESYSYPFMRVADVKIDSSEVPGGCRVPKGRKDGTARLGEEETIIVKFVSNGQAGFQPCKVRVTTPDPGKSFDIQLKKDISGPEYEHRFPYTFDEAGEHVFVFQIDPEGELDRDIDLSRKEVFSIQVDGKNGVRPQHLTERDELDKKPPGEMLKVKEADSGKPRI